MAGNMFMALVFTGSFVGFAYMYNKKRLEQQGYAEAYKQAEADGWIYGPPDDEDW